MKVRRSLLAASNALGIGAASFWSVAEKDIAESPTACRNAQKGLKTMILYYSRKL